MKVLVTGGSGYLGTHVRKYFGADDMSRKTGHDILNPQDVQSVKDYDMVIHLAAHLNKDPLAADEVFLANVDGTINVLKNMRKEAVFIFASTKDVYGRFADTYATVPESCQTQYAGQSALEWSKLIAERYVEYYANNIGFRSCIFRLSTPYAAATEDTMPNFAGHFAEAINMGEKIHLPGGGVAVRDLLHVDDVAGACSAFAGSIIRHGLYNLGGGPDNAVALKELVAKMEEVSGLQAVIDEENQWPPPIPLNYVSDLTLLQQELGWAPTIALDEGLRCLFR